MPRIVRSVARVAPNVRKAMRANRSVDTKPEIKLRQLLWAHGLRGYRKHVPDLPGSPDLAWVGRRVAVFLHGCFWHSCPKCTKRGRVFVPKTNRDYWAPKLLGNRVRFKRQTQVLRRAKWHVVVVWQCRLSKSPDAVVAQVRQALNAPEKDTRQ